MKVHLRPLVGAFLVFAAIPVFAQSFYEARFQSGVTDFNRGAFARAVDELRVAAFGRVDDIPGYETAEIYLALANDKLDRVEDARLATMKVVQAEQINPAYNKLPLPADVRTNFERLLPALLTREQLVNVPAFSRFASQAPSVPPGTPLSSRGPAPTVPTPTKKPNVAVTVKKNEDTVDQKPQPALDYGRLALERVAAGDEAGARRYADLAFAADETNPNAHTALAQIGRNHSTWNEIAGHYAVVRTRRRLTDDESAAYIIALVKIGRVSDANGVRNSLPASAVARQDVRDALSIEPKPVPRPVPQQVPQPAPQPVAPAPVQRAQTPAPAPSPPAPVPAQVAPTPVPESATPSVTDQIAAAERMVATGNIVGARSELRRIALIPTLQRSERQALARALSQTALYAESSAQYRKTYPLKSGEESHMFYEAVNRYELGDYSLARQLITRAMPALPQTPAILAYRDRILAQQ